MVGSAAFFAASLIRLAAPAGDAPEWSGFRGNNGTGVGDAQGLPQALGEEQIAWRTEVPGGYSSPVVAGKHVVLTASDGNDLLTITLDRGTGEVRWDRTLEFDGKRPGANSPAAPTPVTDGERVYVLFHHVGLVAYDFEGTELWRKALGPFNIPHGMSASPLLHGDLLIVLVDQDQGAYLVAFDKKTGAERWKVERKGVVHGYATPAIFQPAEGPAQLVVSGSLQIGGYSLADGAKLWWVDGSGWQIKCVPAVSGDVAFINGYMPSSSEFGMPRTAASWEAALEEHDANADGKIGKDEWTDPGVRQVWFIFDQNDDGVFQREDFEFLQTSVTRTGALFAIKLGGKGDVTGSNLLWTYDDRRGLPDAPSPLAYGEELYLIKDGSLLTALDAKSGAVVKQGRVGESDDYFASPVAADGKVILAGQSGQLAVVRAGRDWEVLSVNNLEEELWSTPALAGDQVFVRTQAALYCFEEPAGD